MSSGTSLSTASGGIPGTEFCFAYDACLRELDAERCGTRPALEGFCLDISYCAPQWSVTGNCVPGCGTHGECPAGEFCTRYDECVAIRGKAMCGERPDDGKAGLCLPVDHCHKGLHAPLNIGDKKHCPNTSKFKMELTEIIDTKKTNMLASSGL